MSTPLEEQLRTTLASIGDGVISADSRGYIVFANKVAESLLRADQGQLLGKLLDEIFQTVNELTRVRMENPVAQVLRGAPVGLTDQTILIAQDGSEIPIDESAAPIRSESGELQGAVLIFRDVTERRRSAMNDRLLASIVESSDDAIVSEDLNGIVTSWNRGAERIFGYTAAEMIGQSILKLIPEDRHSEETYILNLI